MFCVWPSSPFLDYSILLSLTMAVTMDSLGFSSLFRSALKCALPQLDSRSHPTRSSARAQSIPSNRRPSLYMRVQHCPAMSAISIREACTGRLPWSRACMSCIESRTWHDVTGHDSTLPWIGSNQYISGSLHSAGLYDMESCIQAILRHESCHTRTQTYKQTRTHAVHVIALYDMAWCDDTSIHLHIYIYVIYIIYTNAYLYDVITCNM